VSNGPAHFELRPGASLAITIEQATETELVALARTGDEAAFEEIVHRYTPRVFHIASKFFRQRSSVEEVGQEVFLKVYTQLSSFKGLGSFEGWISRIATNTCLNLVRHAKRRPESPVADLTEEEASWLDNKLADVSARRFEAMENSRVAADLAERVLTTLTPDDRLVLTLIDGEDASVKEVSEATGWSESKIKVKAMRARTKMRKAVENLLKQTANRAGNAGGA
jgi:RNA polymerase sigma-70 factor (ECF subfamily)